MIRRYISMAAIVTAAAALSSCAYNIDEVLLQRSDISLTVRGELQMGYKENTCQLGYNEARNEFRVYDDKLANWFILKCDARPTSAGQKLKADLEYTTTKDTKTVSDLTFTVENINSEGMIWLWNQQQKIGIVVKAL